MRVIGGEYMVHNLRVRAAIDCCPGAFGPSASFLKAQPCADCGQARARVLFLRRTTSTSTEPSPDAAAYIMKAFK